ncbi:MAG: NifB/NifX family molybdenum-iron cluster-binding protein [Fusobacteriaceae bacterium]|nr:NifB/NifX family molybdenum-iron cluster-binding protein [Fusobacteriaceae bacterium]
MKIAVCSKGNNLKALSDERFGRCETFIIFDTETKESFAINNEAKNEGAGAGGKAVKILADNKVDVVIAPELGPKACDAIKAFEIEAYRAMVNLTVEEQIKNLQEEKLEKLGSSSVESHSGLRRV